MSKSVSIGSISINASNIDCIQLNKKASTVEIWSNAVSDPIKIKMTPQAFEQEEKRLLSELRQEGYCFCYCLDY